MGSGGDRAGYTAEFPKEEAWSGPWLASFGFVVIGIDANSPDDFDVARGTQLLTGLFRVRCRAPVDHLYCLHSKSNEMRIVIPGLKIFLDDDTRYTQLLCTKLADSRGTSIYRSRCPCVPGAAGTTSSG